MAISRSQLKSIAVSRGFDYFVFKDQISKKKQTQTTIRQEKEQKVTQQKKLSAPRNPKFMISNNKQNADEEDRG